MLGKGIGVLGLIAMAVLLAARPGSCRAPPEPPTVPQRAVVDSGTVDRLTRQIADERRLREVERTALQDSLARRQGEIQGLGQLLLVLASALLAAVFWLIFEIRRRRILHRAFERLARSEVVDGQ